MINYYIPRIGRHIAVGVRRSIQPSQSHNNKTYDFY